MSVFSVQRTDCKAVISTLPGQTLGSEGLQVSFSLSNIHMPRMWVENHPDKDSQVKKWSLHWLLHSKIDTFHLTLPDSNELWCGSDACRPACWCFIQTLSQAGCPAREVRPVWAMWSFFWTPPGRCGETPCWTPAGLPFKSSNLWTAQWRSTSSLSALVSRGLHGSTWIRKLKVQPETQAGSGP